MLTNTGCTLYLTDAKGQDYMRVYCPACHWEDTRGININKTGTTQVDSVEIYIPLDATPPPLHGYIVHGECSFIPSESHPIRELIMQGGAFTITSAAQYDFGSQSMRHWEVYAK